MKEFSNDIIRSIKTYSQKANVYERINYYKKQENRLNFRVVTTNINGTSKYLRRRYIIYLINGMKAFNCTYYKTKNIINEAIPIYLNRLEDLCHNILPISSYKRR